MEANSSAIDGRVYLRRHRDSDLPLKLAPPVAASTVAASHGARRPLLLEGPQAPSQAARRPAHEPSGPGLGTDSESRPGPPAAAALAQWQVRPVQLGYARARVSGY